MRIFTIFLTTLVLTVLAAAQVSFTSTFYPSSGPQGIGETSGDFNRDGKPDIVVGTNNAVDVFFNLGSGKFGNRATYAMPGNASVSIAMDVNNDGWLDIVVVLEQQNTMSVLLNNGDGTFRNGTPITLPLPGSSASAGDLNRDGNVDLVVLECDYNVKCQFQVFKGTGTGTFTAGQVLALANMAVIGPILTDVSGDGKLDLINTRDPKVFVWKGNGDGTFATPTSYQPPAVCDPNNCGDELAGVAVGDFNNDARLDIAVEQGHYCGSACGYNTIYIYKNTGAGSFTPVNHFDLNGGGGGGLVAIADLNGDQNMDLLQMLGGHFDCGSAFAPGKGNFTFGTLGRLPSSCESADLLARDMNLDSRHDLAISDWMGGGWSMNINTNAFTNCAPPSSANLAAKICGPANNASVASPVLVRASGNSPAGVQRLEVWVDGVKKYEKWNDQLAKRFSLAAGSHKITVIAVDLYKGTAKTSVTVNVQ
jgi:hypothetical protein